MSFLAAELEPETMATLDEALAFIDACDLYGTTESGLQSMGHCDASLTAAMEVVALPTKQETKSHYRVPGKKQNRTSTSPSTVLQRRKKAEIVFLKEHVLELEAQLRHLKRSRGISENVQSLEYQEGNTWTDPPNVTPAAIPFSTNKPAQHTWRKLAFMEYQQRVQAEKTNRRLKSILDNQEKLNSSLSGILQKRAVNHESHLELLKTPLGHERPASTLSTSAVIIQQLEKRVQSLYLESHLLFLCHQVSSPSVSLSMQSQIDDRRGTIVELRTTTPIECTMKDASDLLWKASKAERTPSSQPDSLQKNVVMTLNSGSESIQANKTELLRKFVEVDRVVLVWSEIIRLPTRNLQARCDGWTVISRDEADLVCASVEHTLVQLYVDCSSEGPPRTENVECSQKKVLQYLAGQYRACLQLRQDKLMEEATQAGMTSSIGALWTPDM